ncbi:hypothetical protein ABK040_013171 [Willaertia magna]
MLGRVKSLKGLLKNNKNDNNKNDKSTTAKNDASNGSSNNNNKSKAISALVNHTKNIKVINDNDNKNNNSNLTTTTTNTTTNKKEEEQEQQIKENIISEKEVNLDNHLAPTKAPIININLKNLHSCSSLYEVVLLVEGKEEQFEPERKEKLDKEKSFQSLNLAVYVDPDTYEPLEHLLVQLIKENVPVKDVRLELGEDKDFIVSFVIEKEEPIEVMVSPRNFGYLSELKRKEEEERKKKEEEEKKKQEVKVEEIIPVVTEDEEEDSIPLPPSEDVMFVNEKPIPVEKIEVVVGKIDEVEKQEVKIISSPIVIEDVKPKEEEIKEIKKESTKAVPISVNCRIYKITELTDEQLLKILEFLLGSSHHSDVLKERPTFVKEWLSILHLNKRFRNLLHYKCNFLSQLTFSIEGFLVKFMLEDVKKRMPYVDFRTELIKFQSLIADETKLLYNYFLEFLSILVDLKLLQRLHLSGSLFDAPEYVSPQPSIGESTKTISLFKTYTPNINTLILSFFSLNNLWALPKDLNDLQEFKELKTIRIECSINSVNRSSKDIIVAKKNIKDLFQVIKDIPNLENIELGGPFLSLEDFNEIVDIMQSIKSNNPKIKINTIANSNIFLINKFANSTKVLQEVTDLEVADFFNVQLDNIFKSPKEEITPFAPLDFSNLEILNLNYINSTNLYLKGKFNNLKYLHVTSEGKKLLLNIKDLIVPKLKEFILQASEIEANTPFPSVEKLILRCNDITDDKTINFWLTKNLRDVTLEVGCQKLNIQHDKIERLEIYNPLSEFIIDCKELRDLNFKFDYYEMSEQLTSKLNAPNLTKSIINLLEFKHDPSQVLQFNYLNCKFRISKITEITSEDCLLYEEILFTDEVMQFVNACHIFNYSKNFITCNSKETFTNISKLRQSTQDILNTLSSERDLPTKSIDTYIQKCFFFKTKCISKPNVFSRLQELNIDKPISFKLNLNEMPELRKLNITKTFTSKTNPELTLTEPHNCIETIYIFQTDNLTLNLVLNTPKLQVVLIEEIRFNNYPCKLELVKAPKLKRLNITEYKENSKPIKRYHYEADFTYPEKVSHFSFRK